MTVPHAKIRSALRRIWMWQTTRQVRARARLKRGLYRCECCRGFTAKVEVDHAVPLGPTPGSRNADPGVTWDGFIARLFCGPEDLCVICQTCHRQVTEQRKTVKLEGAS